MSKYPSQINFNDFLPELWGSVLFDKIRNNKGVVYGNSFLVKHLEYAKVWIKNDLKNPGKSNVRLRSKNKCVYCNIPIEEENGVGDHVVSGFIDRGIIWTVPCDKKCNSSKGKKDLIEWWCGYKNRNIVELSRDVISIFVRAKYRHLQNEKKLQEFVPEIYHTALQQIKNNWEI